MTLQVLPDASGGSCAGLLDHMGAADSATESGGTCTREHRTYPASTTENRPRQHRRPRGSGRR
jgi:hypothetical protein